VSYLRLMLAMLRYRVASMIWMFMLLGAAGRGGLERPSLRLACAAVVLAATYVAATTANDVADREIDLVNHPRDPGRPLVSGDASVRQLWRVHVGAALVATAAAVPLGAVGLGLAVLSLCVAWAYSLPPLLLSHRTYVTHLCLAVAYVAIPYALGLVVVHGRPRTQDGLLVAALLACFLARIVLKDFRDREGDARFGKPTLLLRFGKRATCTVSAVSLVLGNALLVAALHPPAALALLLELYVGCVALMLLRLHRADHGHDEQVAIGTGARMGNGLLLTVLSWLALAADGVRAGERLPVVWTLGGVFALGFGMLALRPEQAVIGYKG
jgi:4-hydroxybenzoate polyprenyltransferase